MINNKMTNKLQIEVHLILLISKKNYTTSLTIKQTILNQSGFTKCTFNFGVFEQFESVNTQLNLLVTPLIYIMFIPPI